MSGESPAAILYDSAGTEKATAGNPVRTDPTGSTTQPVSAATLPLPAGAATQATLATLLTQADFDARTGDVTASPAANTILGRLKDIAAEIAARLGTLGQKAMAASTPVVIASDQTPVASKITDGAGSELGTLQATTLLGSKPGLIAMGQDAGAVARRLLTTVDGRLITSSAVSAPPGRTQAAQAFAGDVTGTVDHFFIIPTAEFLVIQRAAGGGENDSAGSKVSLWWAPNGDTTGMTLIRAGYVNGGNFEFTLDWPAPLAGNGTRSILLRRERLTGGTVEIAAFWDGYY